MKNVIKKTSYALLFASFTLFVFSNFKINGFAPKIKGEANQYNAEFIVRKINTCMMNVNVVNYFASAFLYSQPIMKTSSWKGENLGNVFFDNSELKFNPSIRGYCDNQQRLRNQECTWQILNSGLFENLSIQIDSTFPTVKNLDFIPSEISKSGGLKILIPESSNYDALEFTVSDGVFRLSAPYYRRIEGKVNQIIIPTEDLASLSGSNPKIVISFIKREFVTKNSINLKIEKRNDVVKHVTLVH